MVPPLRAGLLLLADDLTGACDAGSMATATGRPVRCLLAGRPGWERTALQVWPGTTVVDLETRRLGPRAAARRAGAAARALVRLGIGPAYFKVDSTLRGHPAREAEAIRRGAGRRLAWLVLANPAQGRWTVGGRQFVHGRPVDRTAFAHDPLQPVRNADVLVLAAAAVGASRVAHLTVHDLARGPRHVARLRRRWLAHGVRMVVADALRESHLVALARCIPAADLACGAAAFARYLLPGRVPLPARVLPGKGSLTVTPTSQRSSTPSRSPVPLGKRSHSGRVAGAGSQTVEGSPLRSADLHRTGPALVRGRVLAIIGSVNPVTAEQVRLAARVRGVAVGRGVPRGGRWWIIAWPRWPGTARVARAAAAAFARWRPVTVLCSGGETAAAVAEALGIAVLTLEGELQPGLVTSRARTGDGATIGFVTKPGGFGAAQALARMAAA